MAAKRKLSDFDPGFWDHASHQAMTVYLDAAERDLRQLTQMVAVLRYRRDERKAEAEAGTWPPARMEATDG